MDVDFRIVQKNFAFYIRSAEIQTLPVDVEPRRMAIYRELFFNNIEGFMSNNFPVLRSILDDFKWAALVRDFFSIHVCRTAYFAEIAEEFIEYLELERDKKSHDYPFLLELAHYEWVEMALENAKEELSVNRLDGALGIDQNITISPLAWPLAYSYPVHRIGPAYLPSEPEAEPICLIVYRNADDCIRFIEITPTTYELLQIIDQNGPLTANASLNELIRMMNPPNPESIRSDGLRILNDLVKKNIVSLSS